MKTVVGGTRSGVGNRKSRMGKHQRSRRAPEWRTYDEPGPVTVRNAPEGLSSEAKP